MKISPDKNYLYTQKPKVEYTETTFQPKWKSEIEELAYRFILKGHEYTKPELELLFYDYQLIDKKTFDNNFISTNFSNVVTKRKQIQGKKYTVYRFY